MSKISDQIALLIAAVASQSSVVDSAITLINGFADQLKEATATLAEAGADTSQLVEITNKITTESAALAQAVQANTPAAPTPEPAQTTESVEAASNA